jgi:Protein of unknown function (DUF4007)
MTAKTRFSFSGHETFQCRHLWLKKGYDYVKKGNSFSDASSVVELGVGKNMVRAIRHWMKAFDMLEDGDQLTRFADWLFGENGKDPYLEDDATLWLLHFNLVKKGYATAYGLIFNELRKQRIEFDKNSFIRFVQGKVEREISPNTLSGDFEVFVKLYVGTENSKDKEDIVSGILPDLRIVQLVRRGKNPIYHIDNSEKPELPKEVVLFALLTDTDIGKSVSLETLEKNYNSPGSIFALNRAGLVQKIEDLCTDYDFLTYKDDAGTRELQFKSKPDAYNILSRYYDN